MEEVNVLHLPQIEQGQENDDDVMYGVPIRGATTGFRKHLPIQSHKKFFRKTCIFSKKGITGSVDELKKKSIPDVWQYYIRGKDKTKAKCKICHEVFKYKGGSTSELCKHLETKHEIIVATFQNVYFVDIKIEDEEEENKELPEEEEDEEKADSPEVEDGNEICEEYEDISKEDDEGEIDEDKDYLPEEAKRVQKEKFRKDLTKNMKFKEFNHDRKGGSAVWQYFLVNEDKTYAKCKICLKVLKRHTGSTSGLKNHFIAKHHPKGTLPKNKKNPAELTFTEADEVCDDEQLQFRRYISPVWKSFIRSDDKSYAKCKLCDKVIPCHKSSTSGLSSHLARKHKTTT